MGITKAELFTRDQNRTAQWAKVLGHPARIAILQHILQRNTCVCGSLVDELGLAQATISHCIEPKNWAKAQAVFNALFNKYAPVDRSCC